ncbi:MAG: IS1634 family transposase [Candidatus Krumholzibacteriia bacterium]
MYVATVPNRNSPPAILIRESYRVGGKVKTRTLANITHWEPARIEALRQLLKGHVPMGDAEQMEITRSRPHGHVAAVLGTLRKLGLERMLHSRPSRQRDLAVAMIVGRIVEPASKLATARALSKQTLTSSLGECLGLDDVNENDLYEALDWLRSRQPSIEKSLAKRHLQQGSLVLYDVTSTWLEGRSCPLAKLGYSRDRKKDKLQVVFGLLCEREGRPIGVEVFEGNTGDPRTLTSQILKVRERFELERVVFVGDRGMITEARIREELRGVEGLEWISSLRSPQIRKLVNDGMLQPSLFDEVDLAEIHHPKFPGERLIACRNPLLAAERARKRQEMLAATESKLEEIRKATKRESRPLRGKAAIGVRVGRVFARSKMGKHFRYTINDDSFEFERNHESIEREKALDGIYIVRTSLGEEDISAEEAVKTYKGLAVVERAFRSYKTVDLEVRPIFHYNSERVRAHIFLCMLAYYVEWHMRKALASMLFDDDDPDGAQAKRSSIVSPALVSDSAQAKASTKKTPQGLPVHSFRTLLADLATLTKNQVEHRPTGLSFVSITRPTPLQQNVFDLLKVNPRTM